MKIPPSNRTQKAAIKATTKGLPCALCKKLFAVTHKPIKCQVSGCEVWTHKGERCSTIKKGSKMNNWTCETHRAQEDLPPPHKPSNLRREQSAHAKTPFEAGTLRRCGTLYHKKCCTDLTRDSRDAAAEGLIRWYCKQCYTMRLKKNEDTTVKEHLNDSPES